MADVIHLVRHGEVHNPDNVCYADIEGFGLSEHGRQQANHVGRYLLDTQGPELVAAYTSPLLRARQTYEETGLVSEVGIAATVGESLTEWGLAQRWKGERWDQLDELFPGEVEAYWAHPTELDFSPESVAEMADRMTSEILASAAEYPSGAVVFVSHQDPVQAARLALTGRSLSQLHDDKPAHGSVITLSSKNRGDWIELSHWCPDQQKPEPKESGQE